MKALETLFLAVGGLLVVVVLVAMQTHTTMVQAPVSSQQYYVTLARQDAVNAGINPTIFVRQMNEESGFNPNVVSPTGAVGIAQFEPATAQGLGIDPHNPVQSLQGAARLMRRYLDRYQGSYAEALACYNGGPGAVSYAVAHGGANWQSWLPTETRRYIHTILGG